MNDTYPNPGAGLSETYRDLNVGQLVAGPSGLAYRVSVVHDDGFFVTGLSTGEQIEVSCFAAERWTA